MTNRYGNFGRECSFLFRVSVAQKDKDFEEGASTIIRKASHYLPSDEGICISDDLNFFNADVITTNFAFVC